MSLNGAHPQLLRAALLTVALTPGRSTAALVSLHPQVLPLACSPGHASNPTAATHRHLCQQMGIKWIRACPVWRHSHWQHRRGGSLCLTDWGWHCVCVSAKEGNVSFITTLIIIQCRHSDNTWACWPTQSLFLPFPLPALSFNWSFSS